MALNLVMLCLVVLTVSIVIAEESLDNTLLRITLAQSSENKISPLNKTQEWVSQKDAVKILFTYQPERPIIDTFTKLQFSVINLTENENLKDFDARVVVTNGQRLFKFENISVTNGDFSVEYIFPDDGTHQVITRIDKGTAVRVLASFNVFVPHQAPPSILNPFPSSPENEQSEDPGIILSKILAIALPIAAVFALIIILKMGKAKSRQSIS
jgi:hypothetical protein